jgi:Tfp pilus assembly protein PilF
VRREEFQTALPYALEISAADRQLTFFPVDYPEVLYSARVLAGKAYQGLGEIGNAERAFRQAAQVPVARRSEALGSVSELYRAQGDTTRAREALEEARRIDPDNLQHEFNLGDLLLREGDLDGAEACFAAVAERDPEQTPALLNRGYIARKRGDLGRAEAIYRQAMEHDREGVEARANLAHLLLEQERFAAAGALFEQVRERRTELLDIDLGLLVVRAARGEWPEASRLAAEVCARFPEIEAAAPTPSDTARALLRLGTELVRQNQAKCAEFALLAAASLDPESMAAHRALAELHFARGAYWAAIAQYELLLKSNPEDGAAFSRLGDCYQSLGVAEAARMCYARQRELGC